MRHNVELKSYDNKTAVFEFFGYKPKLQTGGLYTVEIKEYKSNRSIEQNRLMWAIIQEIAKVTGNDEMEIYCMGLEKMNIQADFLLGLPNIEDSLKRQFRAVKIVENREYNGKTMTVFKCFSGSSKFNTAEMTQLIDFFLHLAEENGVYEFENL